MNDTASRKTFSAFRPIGTTATAAVTPSVAYLRGPAEKPLSASVPIVPKDGFEFNITEATADNGENISFTLETVTTGEGKNYRLAVENVKKDKGRYSDTIRLKTDSKIQPVIMVQVRGNII